MIRLISFISILVLIFFVLPKYSRAMGGFLTGDYGQVAPVEVKAIIEFDGKVETITSSQTFTFNPLVLSNFYWVMAFPEMVETAKPDFKKNLLSDTFLQFEKKTQKKFSKNSWLSKLLYLDLIEEKTEPSQIFSRMASIKYLKSPPVFNSLEELEEWFRQNAYPIPKNSRERFAEYVKKRWHFVVAVMDGIHLEMDARESLTISAAHTIPIQVRFKTKKIIYPLKLVGLEPDRDSLAAPLSFPYGGKSEEILGIKDPKVDDLLSTPSSNTYPPLLLDLMHVKIDLFVLAKEKIEAEGFTTVFADSEGDRFLTRVVAYKPMAQLEDVTIERAKDQRRVNPNVSAFEKIVRIVFLAILFLSILKVLIRGKTSRRIH